MRLPSGLIYGFKAKDVEDVRRMLETALSSKFKALLYDDAGVSLQNAT